MAYLGSSRAKSLQEFGAISEKYGGQPGSCSTVFRSTCPWDSAGVSAIVMKLMVSRAGITKKFGFQWIVIHYWH